ncbi:MAG: FG-GAP repeat protein [Bacteroidetes bacterium]|nr:FG-GAP repeat protein [Bacteroidota bacterium]
MKKIKHFLSLSVLLSVFLILCDSANANWNSNETPDTPNTQDAPHSKSDSFPEGVTEDWLNNLKDENGNSIFDDSENSGISGQTPEDPEGDAFQRKIFNGQTAGSFFGRSVASAGDVNGDGYSDIIVGAYGYSSFTGRAYIYYGGVSMNTIADVTMNGEAINNQFGRSVASAGDVNGDGYSDVIVGASGYSSSTGRAYIYYGGAAMNNTADVIMTGEATNNYLGFSVSSAGDINGDGYSDVIAGAYGYSSTTGRAYIYYGGASMNNVSDLIMTGQSSSISFGYSVSSAGDVNGDGFSDVIAGAYGFSGNTGRAYIYFGGASPDIVSDVTMTGEAVSNSFGYSVSSAGDANGDGYSDVIIGAQGYSSNTGRAYIFNGGATMNNVADVVMTGEASGDYFGASISSAGDLNGDGYSDVIAGAYGNSSNTGKVYIYFGAASMDNTADVTKTGEDVNNYFGNSVSSAGDVNGDGYTDLTVGAHGYNANTGRAYLLDYYMKNEITSDLKMTGEGIDNYFGRSVSSAGDVNGDGYSDVIVGAYYNIGKGRAYIYYGGLFADNIPDVVMTGDSNYNYFGNSVSSAGDVNGDGYSDVIIGAYGYNSNAGRAYIYYGGAPMNNVADVIMSGEAADNVFGYSVSSAGDVNGDGYSDVIVGAYARFSLSGAAYIYFGGASMNNVYDVIMAPGIANDFFGISVSNAGDMNGDGFDDVIVGSTGYLIGTGRAYVFFGGSPMNNFADLTMDGEGSNNSFGTSVSTAGDVNGDGFSDVVVGAPGNSSAKGKAYIYFGGTSLNNDPDVVMTGESIQNNFGFSVSTAGDVNGDGYSDVIIGAPDYSSYTGKTYIYLGGISPDNIADVTMTGESTYTNFGTSVSSAGDVNGDGFSDVISGASDYSSSTGRSYVYYGSAISAKPILNYVKDVPHDQGGYVNLKWARSSSDVIGNNLITDYVVYRSYPPGSGQFSWEVESIVPATKRSFYTFTDNTPSDSSAGGNGTMYYRIMARTSNQSQYWLSGILSGRSIDNISPPVVSPFTAVKAGSNVNLNWGANPAPDLKNYILFRSTSPTIDPYTETPLSTVTTTAFIDTSPLSGFYYYFIVAQDIHNNYSPVAVTEIPNAAVNLTLYIQGFYNSGTNSQFSDTLKTTLRSTVSPYNIISSSNAVVSGTGNAVLNFTNAPDGTYYLAVKHRNSIETWSAVGITVTFGGSVNYNFSSSSTQAFGNNMIQIDSSPQRFGIYSGDVNQDGLIDLADGSLIDNDSFNFVSGYVPTDVNGDDVTDLADAVFADNNGFNFVGKITP